MTEEMTPPPAAPQPAFDAKAQAAAAKAYAKAQRPWYKKKRWIATLVIVGLIGISVATSGGGSDPESDSVKSSTADESTKSDSGSDSKPAEKDSSKDEVGTEGNPAPRGTAVQNQSAKYVVNNVEVKNSLGAFADKPSGKYVVVTLTVENVKDETIQVSNGDFTLQVAGVEIDASDQAIMLDDAFTYDDLSPGLKRTGKIAFDVAPKDAGNGVLKAQAMLSMDDAVYLKLK